MDDGSPIRSIVAGVSRTNSVGVTAIGKGAFLTLLTRG